MVKRTILISFILVFLTCISYNQNKNPHEIKVIYNDYGFSESGDVYGTCEICLVFNDGKMTGTIEQRYGTEGGTFPKQSLKELDIKADGRITFNFTYYYLDFSFNILKTEVFAIGQLNTEKLVFRIDKPDTNGFNLDIVK